MKERTRQLAGKLEIMDSQPNKGTLVAATLPISHPRATAAAEPEISGLPTLGGGVEAPNPERDVSPKRILIADDHEMLRRGLRAMLEKAGDWQICGEATDGAGRRGQGDCSMSRLGDPGHQHARFEWSYGGASNFAQSPGD